MYLENFLHACPSKVAIISTKQKPNWHPSINLYMQANGIVFTVWLTIVANKIQANTVPGGGCVHIGKCTCAYVTTIM